MGGLALVLGLAGCGSAPREAGADTASGGRVPELVFQYPITATNDVVDVYHGVRVADPYRWLEDDNSEATRRWVAEQNALTFAYLERIAERPAIRSRLASLWNYERFGIPFKRGGHYFYTRNDGLQNQSVLCVSRSLEGPATVLLDPNTLSADGTVALTGFAVSDDGGRVTYGVASGGSDW